MFLSGKSKIKFLKDPNCHCANGLVRNEDGKVGFKICYQIFGQVLGGLSCVKMDSPSSLNWALQMMDQITKSGRS